MSDVQELLSASMRRCLDFASQYAIKHSHPTVEPVHLMIALIESDQQTNSLLRKGGAIIVKVLAELNGHLGEIPKGPSGQDGKVQIGEGLREALKMANVYMENARQRNSKVPKLLDGPRILMGMTRDGSGAVQRILGDAGIHHFDLPDLLEGDVRQIETRAPSIAGSEGEHGRAKVGKAALEAYCVNLNEKSALSRGRVLGRDAEVRRLIEVLSKSKKPNALMIGEAGIGKTAVAEALAHEAVAGNMPPNLRGAVVWALDMGAILAGTRYRGDFEERFKAILAELKAQPKAILFIDEIHVVMGSGDSKGGMNGSDLMKEDLGGGGGLRCLGATTRVEYRKFFEHDRAMRRRFTLIELEEPGRGDAIAIVENAAGKIGKHHGVDFAPGAFEAAVDLSIRWNPEFRLPDKAIDALDEAASALAYDIHVAFAAGGVAPEAAVSVDRVAIAVARSARKPVPKVGEDEMAKLRGLEDELKRFVFGQDEAMRALTRAVRVSRAGLREEGKTVGSYLFCGPTGVGKTETARRLADTLGVECVRFDMSEYMEPHSVSRLLGPPPGYVGYDKGGLLTEAVAAHPHCVLLLDEVEKGHKDIYNILLQVMDYGSLTDAHGRKIDFGNVILIMSTNAGAAEAEREVVGFGRSKSDADESDGSVEKLFTPEFRNRLDAVLRFRNLRPDVMGRIVEKSLAQLEKLLGARNVAMTADERAKRWLAEKGYDRERGARPLSLLVQADIKVRLSEEILFGNLTDGGSVALGADDEGLTFDVRGIAA